MKAILLNCLVNFLVRKYLGVHFATKDGTFCLLRVPEWDPAPMDHTVQWLSK